MTDATKPAGDLVRSLQILGADFRSHPVANGTIERTEEAGELMHEAADEIDRLTAALADRERAIAEAVPDVWLVKVSRLVQGFEHVSGIARLWEPDYSTGSERALWARATEACADVAALLREARSGAKG